MKVRGTPAEPLWMNVGCVKATRAVSVPSASASTLAGVCAEEETLTSSMTPGNSSGPPVVCSSAVAHFPARSGWLLTQIAPKPVGGADEARSTPST